MPIKSKNIIAAALLALLVGGCVIEVTPTGPITVVLVNDTTLDVRPGFYTSATATDAAGLFVDANLRTDFTDRDFPELRGEESVTLSIECDDATSIGVSEAVLFDALQLLVTPSDDQVLLLRGTNYQCEATIRITYYTEEGEFRVRSEVQ